MLLIQYRQGPESVKIRFSITGLRTLFAKNLENIQRGQNFNLPRDLDNRVLKEMLENIHTGISLCEQD